MDLATSCYENACNKYINNLEIMMGLFNCYVREYSYVKQQKVCLLNKVTLACFALFFEYSDDIFFPCTVVGWQKAIKMYKAVGEERFLMWAVCSIQFQVLLTSFSIKH